MDRMFSPFLSKASQSPPSKDSAGLSLTFLFRSSSSSQSASPPPHFSFFMQLPPSAVSNKSLFAQLSSGLERFGAHLFPSSPPQRHPVDFCQFVLLATMYFRIAPLSIPRRHLVQCRLPSSQYLSQGRHAPSLLLMSLANSAFFSSP